MITILEFPLVFIIGLVYWMFAFNSTNLQAFITLGNIVIIGVPFVLTIIRFVFGKHKIKRGRKLAKCMFLITSWLLSEAAAVACYTYLINPMR